MVSNCDLFYLVESGDSCQGVSTAAGISLSDFYAWNPAVGTSCQFFKLSSYLDAPGQQAISSIKKGRKEEEEAAYLATSIYMLSLYEGLPK